ncbi:hypothetical protein KGF57_001712 [Candida theae]|uniref:Lysophospholipase n=1 Tax=Candida theae TaxID=1198502 RepID=A0AAD5FZN2_9ASCO|nr:uncharacterized protein KGF57_001712 [Candida theae]KAI5961475.1 hypothetical protein KGF57_001712 [Candida theae]
MQRFFLLYFYLLATALAVWPFEQEENTLGATPSTPWWEGIFGAATSTSAQSSSTESQQTSPTSSAAQAVTTSSSSSSSSSQPWYAGIFGALTSSSQASSTSAPSATSQTGRGASQSASVTSSRSSTSSQGGIEGWLGGLYGSSSSRGSSSQAQSTDETQTNSDGDGVANPYSPVNITCPETALVRKADGLSDNEKNYVEAKQEQTNKFLISFLNNRANLSDFDAESFINENSDEHNITIGLAFSGGGYRAMLAGAGSVLALDDRFEDSNTNALGGLLQSSTYLVGLSGGSWLVGTLVLNNWISVENILNGSSQIWDLETSILDPNAGDLVSIAKFYTGVGTSIVSKNRAGFNTSVTDIWGRALSHQLLDDSSGGANLTWSSVRNLTSFEDYSMPFPILVADGKTIQAEVINPNTTFVVEISPFELGNFDALNGFVNTEYLGSSIQDGDAHQCVRNYDNAGFVMGTSSSVFNSVFSQLNNYDVSTILRPIFDQLMNEVSDSKDDVAIYDPNPFYEWSDAQIDKAVNNNTLSLVDGGDNGQNVPFYPLIQPDRNVDVIFAFDNSADTKENWPNGTSFVDTYKWQFSDQGKGTPFPYVPTVDTYLKDDLKEKPLFFGCNASDLSDIVKFHDKKDLNETDVPLVVYISNHHESYLSNFSTFKLAYDNAEKTGTIRNGYEVVSRGNLTEDSNWATCVGCAIIRRQQERLGEQPSEECAKCFQEYCWTGTAEDAPQVSAFTGSNGSSNSTNSSNSTGAHSSTSSTSAHNSTSSAISSSTQRNNSSIAGESRTGSTQATTTPSTVTTSTRGGGINIIGWGSPANSGGNSSSAYSNSNNNAYSYPTETETSSAPTSAPLITSAAPTSSSTTTFAGPTTTGSTTPYTGHGIKAASSLSFFIVAMHMCMSYLVAFL